MINENLRKITSKWKRGGISQNDIGKLTKTNRGKVSSYIRDTRPDIVFMFGLEAMLGYKFTLRQLWYEDIPFEDIPERPVENPDIYKEPPGSKRDSITSKSESLGYSLQNITTHIVDMQEEILKLRKKLEEK